MCLRSKGKAMENKELVKEFYLKELGEIESTLKILKAQQDYLSNIIMNCERAKDCKNCRLGWEDGSCIIVNSEGLEGEF